MSWKTALYNYVHAKNQSELEGSAAPLEAYMSDSAYVRQQDVRVRRLLESFRDRDAKLLRGETKLRLTGVRESGQGIIADIQLHRFLHYRIGSATHVEERIEPERVIIDSTANCWQVRSTEPLNGEKSLPNKSRGVFFPEQTEYAEGHRRAPSLPYINHSILNSGAQEFVPRKIIYNRAKAVQYAETWWQTPNPKYEEFEVDCTNYVSQCLFAGGAPMENNGKRDSGCCYAGKKGQQKQWSFSWP